MSGNAKQRRTLRRALDRAVSIGVGWADGPLRLARRFRDSASFWRLVERCEDAARGDGESLCVECGGYIGAAGFCRRCDDDACDDPWGDDGDSDEWDDEDRDEDDDPVGCWESGKFRAGFCPDDLRPGANRCMAKARPWEGGDESSEEDVTDAC